MQVHDVKNDVFIGIVKEITDEMVYLSAEKESWTGTSIENFDARVDKPVVGSHVVLIYTEELGFVARVFLPETIV